jgi:hypothetical protein
VASPVSTYVRPADPGRNSLADLAEGLAAFDSGLGAYLQKRKAETEEDDKAKAITDFHRNNQVPYAEAVRQGLIPATSSKSYVEWYKRSQGELAGLKLQDKFDLDYQQWEGRHDADSGGYNQWVSQWLQDNVGDDQDPNILKGLAPRLEQLSMGGYETFLKERDTRLKENARATTGALITDRIVKASDDAKAGDEVDQEALWDGIMSLRKEALDQGNLASDYDSQIVDSILLQAETKHDESLLKLLDRKLPGQDSPMSYDPKVRDKVQASRERIEGKLASMATSERVAEDRQDKKDHEEYWTQAVDLLSTGKDVPEDLIKKLSRLDGQARLKIEQFKKTYRDLDSEEDPEALLHVLSDIYGGSGKDYVLQAMKDGRIKKAETLDKALKTVEAVSKESADDGILSTQTAKSALKYIERVTGLPDEYDPFGPRGLTKDGMEALYDYRSLLLTWATQHPGAGVLEREKAARDLFKNIQESFEVSEENTIDPDNPIYNYGPAHQGEANRDDPSLSVGPQADTSERQLTPPTAPPLDSLPEARRAAIERFAKKRGLSPKEAYLILFQRVQKIMRDVEDQ